MKTKEELDLAWKRLSEHPDFEDCVRDLMRSFNFWDSPREISTEKALCKCASRAVITYIFTKVEWDRIPGDFTFDEKTQRMQKNQRNRK